MPLNSKKLFEELKKAVDSLSKEQWVQWDIQKEKSKVVNKEILLIKAKIQQERLEIQHKIQNSTHHDYFLTNEYHDVSVTKVSFDRQTKYKIRQVLKDFLPIGISYAA